MVDISVKLVSDGVYTVHYVAWNKYTDRPKKNKFNIHLAASIKDRVNERSMLNIVKSAFDNIKPTSLTGIGGQSLSDVPRLSPAFVKKIVYAYVKSVLQNNDVARFVKEADSDQAVEVPLSGNARNLIGLIKSKDFDKKKSIFAPEESAKTYCLLGSSFSGKTTLLVQELNKLDKNDYTRIFLFTESIHAKPLEDLRPDLKVNIYEIFNPVIPKMLKNINTAADNRFRFLVILDDVVSHLKGPTLIKQILTMRNSNISTCLLLQYAKLIGPQQRNSIHEYYILRLRVDDWIHILRGYLASHFKDVLGIKTGSYQKLAEIVRDICSPPTSIKSWKTGYIVKYDQRRDTLEFYNRQ